MPSKKRPSNGTPAEFGANQHRERPILQDLPNLKEILQGYVDAGIKEDRMSEYFMKDYGIQIGLRTIQKYKKKLGVMTKRHNGLSDEQKVAAIDFLAQDDPLGRWGGRLVQEKLARHSIHIPCAEVLTLRRLQDPEASALRHPRTRKIHHHGIWSIGPNEEWCVDGHEKILQSMGIAIYGVMDKYSRMELGLYAMPSARIRELPPAVFLRVVKEIGGMPLTVTGDKGGELGLLISLVTAMRQRFQPFLPEDRLPAFKAVKSVYNITRERGWRPLHEKELANLVSHYNGGKLVAGFVETDQVHVGIAYWLWGRITQELLDELVIQHRLHKTRKQKKILLPSGERRIDLYTRPQDYGAEDRLIPADQDIVDELLDEYGSPDLLLFGSPESVAACEELYNCIGCPKLTPRLGWSVFKDMVTYYIHNVEKATE